MCRLWSNIPYPVYHEQTQPLIEYYSGKGVLKEVDGTQPMDDVFAAIVKILG